jgi:hypothetical protein
MSYIDPEEILRRELRAAAESIEPAADGLNQIRARLSAPRPLAVAWVMVGWATVGQPALVRLDQVFEAVAEWLRPVLHPVAERLRPVTERLHPVYRTVRAVFTPHTGPGGRRSRYAWLRPALAIAGVVAVVAVGSFALAGVPNGVISDVGNFLSNSPAQGSHSGGRPPRENGNGQQIPTTSPGNRAASPSPSASCSPTPTSTPAPTTSTAPAISPSPTPTPSPSPSPSATPSPSPSASPSPTSTSSASGDTPPSGSGSAQDTSLVVMAGSAHRSLVAKPHACT